MTSVQSELRRIVEKIAMMAEESYIKKTIGKPSLPLFFVYLLFFMMKAKQILPQRIESYCIATSLLQMGLSTHEQITIAPQLPPEQMQKRQLVVLSGDYYTSLFYQGLAEVGEIEGIHLLSQVIRSINEMKMTHYTEGKSHMQLDVAALKRIQYIESGLLTALTDFFYVGTSSSVIWKEMGANLLLLDWLRRHAEWAAGLHDESLIWVEKCGWELRQAIAEFPWSEGKEQLQTMVDGFVFAKKGVWRHE
jgi:heptaprenyl diphosphate synthase